MRGRSASPAPAVSPNFAAHRDHCPNRAVVIFSCMSRGGFSPGSADGMDVKPVSGKPGGDNAVLPFEPMPRPQDASRTKRRKPCAVSWPRSYKSTKTQGRSSKLPALCFLNLSAAYFVFYEWGFLSAHARPFNRLPGQRFADYSNSSVSLSRFPAEPPKSSARRMRKKEAP